MLGGSVGMTPSEKAPPKVRGPLHKADSRQGAAFGLGVLKRRLNNGDQKASEPATVGGRYVNGATAKMARLTRRYKVGCSEPASESGRYMRVGHRGNHKGARDSPRPLHFKEKRKADPSLRRPRTENVRRKKRPAAVRDDKFF